MHKLFDFVGSKDLESSSIRNAAEKISDYQNLCKYSSAAETLVELRKALEMTGDFSDVEAAIISKKVCTIYYSIRHFLIISLAIRLVRYRDDPCHCREDSR